MSPLRRTMTQTLASLLALALALALAHGPAPARATTCTAWTEPTLCGSSNQVEMPLDACGSGSYTFSPMESCCRLQAEVPQPCQLEKPADGSVCRSVSIGAASCPPDSPDFCSVQEMKLKINLRFQTDNKTCCDQCACYGDPHCEAFDGRADSWVLCDARDASAGKGVCPMSQSVCESQRDHLGRPCEWHTNPTGGKWVVGLQGSPCFPAESPAPPQMLMYAADDFSLFLTMGERSIIQSAIITDGTNRETYVLDAANCFNSAGGGSTPWRVNPGDASAPSDPNWLPYSWTWIPLDGGDVLWTVAGLPSSIDVSIRCTRTQQRTKTGIQYSAPRLNIENLVEPVNWRPELASPTVNTRKNVDGFCPLGVIAKQGSTSNTDFIMNNGLCQSTTDDLTVAKILCNPGVTQPGVKGCQANWCKSVRLDWETCYADIQTYTWGTTWCAAATVKNGTAADCASNRVCKQCMTAFQDGLSWQQVIQEFGDTQVSDDSCVPQSELASDLVECQAGVTVQYEASPGVWVPYLGVPASVRVCGDQLSFDSQKDAVLFTNKVRIAQCSQGVACLTDKCQSTPGWTASFSYEATPSTNARIVDLFNEGTLICEPTLFPGNPTGCVTSGVTPSPTSAMCPCD